MSTPGLGARLGVPYPSVAVLFSFGRGGLASVERIVLLAPIKNVARVVSSASGPYLSYFPFPQSVSPPFFFLYLYSA